MNRLVPSLLTGWLGGAALAIFLTVPALADGPPKPPVGPESDLGQLPLAAPVPVKLSDYWLGIGFRPLEDALRTQLGLPEGQGLLVDQVMPEAPAARAEVKKHDIVLKADGKPLKEIRELVEAVEAAKDGELSLEIIREGKPITIKVKPEKRPQMVAPGFQPAAPGQPGWDDMAKRLEQFWPGQGKHPPYHLRFFNPGVILPGGAPIHPPLPGNLSVTIHREGDKPAKIDVKRGDESWSVDENGLDALPPDVAVHVKRMLGNIPFDLDDGSQVKIESRGGLRGALNWPKAFGPDGEGRLEKRLEEMNRRIERLQEMIEGSHEKRPRDKGSDKKTPEVKTPKDEQKEV